MILSKSKIFLILCLGFIVGVWLGKYVNREIMAVCAMFFVAVATIGWQNRLAKIIGFAGLVLVLGMTRIYFSLEQNDLKPFYGQTLEIRGIVTEEADVRSDKTYLTVDRLQIDGRTVDSELLAAVARFPEYEYGDEVKFKAKVQEPKDAEAKGEFSYKNYLSRFGIEAVVYYPSIEKLGSNQASKIKYGILKIKKRFVQNISQIMPEPQNSFLAGLLVGLRRGIPDDLLNDFNATGTTHIIAISGFNITIIAQFLDLILLKWFARRISFVLSLLGIFLFVIMVGASSSVVRAGIMGALGLIALNLGRVNVITNALSLTAAVMVGINPKILHFDVGFQLSFFALLGLIYIAPLIEPYFIRIPKVIRIYLVATLSAQIFTVPLLLLNFDRLSLIAPITNLLVLPVIPITMLFGFIAGLLSFVHQFLALPLAWIAWILLEYVIKVVHLTAKLPLASLEYKNFQITFLLFYYSLLVGILIAYNFQWRLKPKTI